MRGKAQLDGRPVWTFEGFKSFLNVKNLVFQSHFPDLRETADVGN